MKPAVTTLAAYNAWQVCIFTAPDPLPRWRQQECAKPVTRVECYMRITKYSLMQINDSFDVVRAGNRSVSRVSDQE
jgi:hypothetical protein